MKIFLYFLLLSGVLANDLLLQELAVAINSFSASLYNVISKNSNKSFLASPLAAEIALAFAQSGCRGKTAEEIRSSLMLMDSQTDIENGFITLLPTLTGNGYYTLHKLNKIYVRKNFQVKSNFLKIGKRVFGAESARIDFSKIVRAARSINSWASKNSKNKIGNLVTVNSLSPRTQVILLNAIYLKASWSSPFSPASTTKQIFYVNPIKTVSIEMMYQSTNMYNYHRDPALDASFLEVPLRGDEASMVFVLPNSKFGLRILETQLQKALGPFNPNLVPIKVGIPKFRVETKINLKFVLKELGVTKAFDQRQADLSGIAGKKGSLAFSEMVQKAFINVSEGGIETAAGTDDVNFKPNYTPSAFSGLEFIADHPFLFYVKIKQFIAFVGRVLDPTM